MPSKAYFTCQQGGASLSFMHIMYIEEGIMQITGEDLSILSFVYFAKSLQILCEQFSFSKEQAQTIQQYIEKESCSRENKLNFHV